MVGTRKGLWIGRARTSRADLDVRRPRRDASEVHAVAVDTAAARPDRPRLFMASKPGTGARRCCTPTTSARTWEHGPDGAIRLPRGHRRAARAGLAARARRRDPTWCGPAPSRGAVPLRRPRPDLHARARAVGPPAPRGVGRRLRRPGLPHAAAAPDRPAAADRRDLDRRRLPDRRRRRARGRRATRASGRSSCPRAQQYPEFGQCVHKVARAPVATRAALRAEPRRRLPLRRRGRLVDLDRRRAALATSASRSSSTRTTPTPSTSSRSRAPTAATRPRARPGSGAPATPARPGRRCGDEGCRTAFFVGVMRDAHVAPTTTTRPGSTSARATAASGARSTAARPGASWSRDLPDVMVVRAARTGVRRGAVRRTPRRSIRRMPDRPRQRRQPDIKPRSRDVTDGLEKAAARGMLRAVGMGDDDWAKPQIGVASSWNEITPCNLSLDRLAKAVKNGVHAAGGYPLEFGTISVSDGISMGHEGMHFSLVSREVIADSRRDGDDGRAARRLGAARRLRQVAARHADGRGPPRPRLGLPLRRLDHARPGRRPATSRSSTPSRPSARASPARSRREEVDRDRARDLSRARAPAAACTPPTRWPPSARRSACRCPARPRRPPSTAAATGSRTAPARPSSRCCGRASPPGRS